MRPPAADDRPYARTWPPRLQVAAAVGWSSFLAACLGELLCFAALDPQVIIDGLESVYPGTLPGWVNHTGLYTIGFFLFWLIAAVAGFLTAYLGGGEPPAETSGQRPGRRP